MPRLGPLARAFVLIIGTSGMCAIVSGLWLLGGGARLLLGTGTSVRLCLGLSFGVILMVLGMLCLRVAARRLALRPRGGAV
jgi:hypothetical protein